LRELWGWLGRQGEPPKPRAGDGKPTETL